MSRARLLVVADWTRIDVSNHVQEIVVDVIVVAVQLEVAQLVCDGESLACLAVAAVHTNDGNVSSSVQSSRYPAARVLEPYARTQLLRDLLDRDRRGFDLSQNEEFLNSRAYLSST